MKGPGRCLTGTLIAQFQLNRLNSMGNFLYNYIPIRNIKMPSSRSSTVGFVQWKFHFGAQVILGEPTKGAPNRYFFCT